MYLTKDNFPSFIKTPTPSNSKARNLSRELTEMTQTCEDMDDCIQIKLY